MSTIRSLTLALCLSATHAVADPIVLVDRARDAGIFDLTVAGSSWYGGGVAFVDLDNDNWPDLYFGAAANESDTLCHNQNDGTFACAPVAGVAANATDVLAITAGDYDNDGDLDLYIMRKGFNSLYRNDGGLRFVDITAQTGTAGAPFRLTTTGTFFDFDGDGRLDLYLGHWFASMIGPKSRDQILRQNADGTFTDVFDQSGVDDHDRSSLAMIAFDYDRDGKQDLYISGDFADDLLFHNDGGGHFHDVTGMQPLGFHNAVTEGMGVASADLDGDTAPDLYVTGNQNNDGSTGAVLLVNQRDGTFASNGVALGVNAGYSWGTGIVDLDNDGWPDIFVATDVADHYSVYRNESGKAFTEQQIPGIEAGSNQCVTAAFADYDNDGRVDIILHRIDGHHPQLLHNETASANHWLQVLILSTHGDELGARVRVHTVNGVQERELLAESSKGSESERRFTFGIGAANSADVEVLFTDGTTVSVANLAADREVGLDRTGVVPLPHPAGCAIGSRSSNRSAIWGLLSLLLLLRLRARRRRSVLAD